MAVVTGAVGGWPQQYSNSLWFSDYAKGGVFVAVRNSQGRVVQDRVQMVLDSSVLGLADL